jgi:hypothetical protein
MSAGPIKQWRDGMKVPPASTTPTTAMHARVETLPRPSSKCGRRLKGLWSTTNLPDVTCADCLAALRADGLIA